MQKGQQKHNFFYQAVHSVAGTGSTRLYAKQNKSEKTPLDKNTQCLSCPGLNLQTIHTSTINNTKTVP